MSETRVFQTRMGHTFYEHTVPELVRQLARLNELLERLIAVQEPRRREDDNANT